VIGVVTVVEAILLAIALVYIVALLRSHADILRRLSVLEEGGVPADATSGPSADDLPQTAAPGRQPAVAISGLTLSGDAVTMALGPGSPTTLLAFLTSGCASCAPLWEGLRDPSARTELAERTIVVTHGSSRESPARLSRLAPPGADVVMSSDAWAEYAVPASPHFVLTDGRGGILGRGSALSWSQLETMLQDARADGNLARPVSSGRRARTTAERAERSERMLVEAGIGPGHPSLYPGSASGPLPDEASR
jgi:hypothetical protein